MLTRVAIDGHVHLREPSHDAAALRHAAGNFARCGFAADHIGVLMLAEGAEEGAYERLRAAGDGGRADGLRIHRTEEAESLWVHVGDWRLLVVAGRQVVTAERLEVLALATSQRFEDGIALTALLRRITGAGAIPVIPWGCGKWLGVRRAHVEAALRTDLGTPLLLGDNGGRPALWRERLLTGSRSARVLRGTDPLPLAGHWRRIGRFGCVADIALSTPRPAADLRRALRDPAVPLVSFGRLQHPAAFLHDQIRLHLSGAAARASNRRAVA